eukprot:gene10852-biopygen3382
MGPETRVPVDYEARASAFRLAEACVLASRNFGTDERLPRGLNFGLAALDCVPVPAFPALSFPAFLLVLRHPGSGGIHDGGSLRVADPLCLCELPLHGELVGELIGEMSGELLGELLGELS